MRRNSFKPFSPLKHCGIWEILIFICLCNLNEQPYIILSQQYINIYAYIDFESVNLKKDNEIEKLEQQIKELQSQYQTISEKTKDFESDIFEAYATK